MRIYQRGGSRSLLHLICGVRASVRRVGRLVSAFPLSISLLAAVVPVSVVVSVNNAAGHLALCDSTLAQPTTSSPVPAGAGAAAAPQSDYQQQSASVVHFPDGGADYEFTGPNGMTEHYPVPPQGFNPDTAPSSELEEYGYPTRPSSGVALSQWENQVGRIVPSTPIPDMSVAGTPPQQSGHLPGSGFAGPAGPSLNWSGYQANQANNTSTATLGVDGQWTQPQSWAPGHCPQASGVIWVGLGDGATQYLAQAGLSLNDTAGIGCRYNNQFWWEFYPANAIQCTPLVLQAGHLYQVEVTWTNTPTCINTSEVWWAEYDETTGGQSTAGYICVGTPAGAAQAEWIAERPGCGQGCYADLSQWANPLSWDWSSDYDTASGLWEPAGDQPTETLGVDQMINGTDDLAWSQSYNYSYGSFLTNWINCI